MAKSNFIVRGGGDFSGLYKEFNKAQKKMTAFQNGIKKSLKILGTIVSTVAIGKLVKDSTQAAMSVESSITQLSRIMGQNATIFEDWVQTQAKAFGMAREEAYKYAATYGNLISTFTRDTQETTKYTTELLKASAVVASATGRTMEDTMERIRSGLLGNTEAIEDLGINVEVAMIESTEAFKKFAKNRSWQELTYQEQQQIRLMAILEQANTKYGDSLSGTTATKQMMFLTTLKNIRLNLGQAFLPIYNTILPALTALASKIEYITRVFAQFSQALFGESTQIQTKQTQAQADAMTELGDATEEAGEQAKGAVAGFDEINQLNMGDTSSTGVIEGVSDIVDETEINTIDDETTGVMQEVGNKAQEMADKVKKAFTDMKNAIVENKNIIIPAIGAISGALVGLALFKGYNNIISWFQTLKKTIQLTWLTLKANPMMLVAAGIGALIGAFVLAYTTNDKFRERVNELWNTIKSNLSPVIEKLGDILKTVWETVFVPFGEFLQWLWQTVLLPVATVVRDVLAIAFDVLGSVVKNVWENILVPLIDFFNTLFMETINAIIDILSTWWNDILVPIGDYIATIFQPIIEALSDVFMYLWKNVLKPLIEFMAGAFKTTFETVTQSIGEIIEGLKTTFVGLINFIAGIFTADWERAWEGVKDIFKGIFESLYGFVKAPLNLIIDAINTVISGLNKLSIDIPDWVPGFGGQRWGISIPKIPKLAKGGITNGPMLAMIGDNPGGREVVSPLDDLLGMITTAVSNTNSSGGDINLTVKIGEDTITQKVISNINRQSRISGTTVIQV